jgi:ribosomal protein RSM22 (predicted rRNA methylase)
LLPCAADDMEVEFSAEERQAAVLQLHSEIFGSGSGSGSSSSSLEADSASEDEELQSDADEWFPDEADERLAAVAAQMTWRERDKLGYDAAAAASGRWGRVIRPPRRRGRHVVLDVCAAARAGGAEGSGAQGEQGQLERHVVAKSDAGKAVGPAGYKLAQKAGWGDLWPSPYMRHTLKEVLTRKVADG